MGDLRPPTYDLRPQTQTLSSYTCSNCGAPITPAQTICHTCGSEIAWDEAVGRVRYVSRLAELGPPRGPRFRSLLLASLVMVAAMAVVLLAGLWGIEQGLQERRAMIGDVAFEHYRQGLLHLLDGQVGAAREEFAQVVAVQPMRTPTPTVTPTPTTGPTPTSIPSTPTPSLNDLPPEEALALIQSSLDGGDWLKAIEELHTLRDQDPGYQAGLVGQMLFNAHYNLALQYESEGDIDAAAVELGKALGLRPGNTAALKLQRAIELYRRGEGALGHDWEAAIAAYTELFALDPEFLDTPDRLFQAYAGLGDSLRRSDACQAVERYQLALQLKRDPQVRAKLEDARLRCSGVEGAPDAGSSGIAVGGTQPAPLSGRIAYTYFDDEHTYHVTRLWDLDENEAGPIIAGNALQPDIAADGRIAVRATSAGRFGITVYDEPGGNGQRLSKDAGDSLPRWSPDGSRILFHASSRTPEQDTHLYLLEVESGAVEDLGAGQGGAWSPDGERIAYQGCDVETSTKCGLWLLDLQGGERSRLTTIESDSKPVWSPDGRLIAFMSAGRSPSWDIFVVDAASGNIPLFSLDDASDGLPVWSPDGSAIAFLSNREGDWAVYVWSLNDLSVDRLFAVPGSLPAWREAGMDWAP